MAVVVTAVMHHEVYPNPKKRKSKVYHAETLNQCKFVRSVNQMATGPPILSFGPMPFLRTAIRPMTRPSPAMPVEHQSPVEYCWAILCPFWMSTASVVAAEMAKATPEPIWNAVLSYLRLAVKSIMVVRSLPCHHKDSSRRPEHW